MLSCSQFPVKNLMSEKATFVSKFSSFMFVIALMSKRFCLVCSRKCGWGINPLDNKAYSSKPILAGKMSEKLAQSLCNIFHFIGQIFSQMCAVLTMLPFLPKF